MKIFNILLVLFLASCAIEPPQKIVDAGTPRSDDMHVPNNQYRAMAVHCLRDFLTGEDAGGAWTIVEKPIGSILVQGDLDGTDNPCVDFADYGCGIYIIQYKVTQPCCVDSSRVRLNKRCCNVTGTLSCN
jgi:hypothetical protein